MSTKKDFSIVAAQKRVNDSTSELMAILEAERERIEQQRQRIKHPLAYWDRSMFKGGCFITWLRP